MVRLLIRVFSYTLAILFVMVLSLLVFLQSDFSRERIKRLIVYEIQNRMQCQLVLENIEGNILTNIILKRVKLNVGKEKIFDVHQIKINYFLPALFGRTLYIRDICLYRPRTALIKDKTENWNYQLLPLQNIIKGRIDAYDKKDAWSFIVKNIKVKDGTLSIIDHKQTSRQSITRDVKAINFSARIDFEKENNRNHVILSFKNGNFMCTKPLFKVVGFEGMVGFNGTDITINNMEIQTESSKGKIKGSVKNIKSPSLDFHMDFPHLSFKDIRAFYPGLLMEGTISTSIYLRGPIDALRLNHRLTYNDLKMENYGVVNIGDISKPKFSIHSKVKNFELQKFLPLFVPGISEENIQGNINFDAYISAEGKEFSNLLLNLNLSINPSRVYKTKIEKAKINFALNKKYLHITPSVLKTSFGLCTLYGKGYIGGLFCNNEIINFTLNTNIKQLDISKCTDKKELKSKLNLSAEISGTKEQADNIKDILLAWSVQIKPSVIAGIPVKRSVIEGHLKREHCNITTCHILSDKADIKIEGKTILKEDIDINLSYHFKTEDMRFIANFFPNIKVQGGLESSGKMKGTLKSPFLDVKLNGQNICYRHLTLQSLHAKIKGKKEEKYPTGEIDLEASGIEWKGIPMERIDFYGNFDQNKSNFLLKIKEKPNRRYKLAGNINDIGPKAISITMGTAKFFAGPIIWANKYPVQISFIPHKGINIQSFKMHYGDQEISLTGELGFSQLFNLHADFNSIQIDTACKVLKTKIPIKGKFHGSLNIKGDFQSPIITGNIRSRESNIGNFSLNKIVATFNYAQRLLYIKADSESNKQELFRVDGIIPVDLSFRPTKERLLLSGLDLSLECKKIDMDFISSFTKEIERVSGRMSFKVLARGNPGNPAIQGSAYIDNGVIRIAKTGLEYHELRGHIQFNNNTIIIEELSLMGGEGKVNITGNISLKDFRPYRLNMDIKCGKFKVINTSLLSGVVDADLNIKGPLSHHFLTGTIKLIESNINFSEIKKRRPEEIEIIEAEATGEEKVTEKREDLPFFLNNLCIDLNIIVPGNNHVKFMGFDAEIKGELAFKKAKKEPFLIEGNIQTICGSYHVRGREFIIKEGKITFSGFPRMDANLNLKAVCKISKLTVIMLLNGTLNNPRIAFQSNPPRKQADIIASLFFGRPVNKLTKSEEIQLQETAMSIMGGLAADQVKGILGERFTPDTVDIKTDKGVGFEMGKYINEQLFLIYERKFGIETSDQMRVEYQLTDRFSINSQIGSEKTSGIDLFWILDY